MMDLIKKHLDDLAAGNWSAYRAALAPNVVHEEVATRQTVQGPDEYVQLVQRWKTAFPDLRAQIKDVISSGDRVVVEVEWEGTHRGSLQAPFGTIPATNKTGRIPATLVMRVENGKIRSSRHYFDLFSLMTQLGLAPNLSQAIGGGSAQVQPSGSKRP